MNELMNLLPFSDAELGLHSLVLFINLLLLIFSKPLVSLFKQNNEKDFQLSIFRTLNLLFLFFHLLDFSLIIFHKDYQNIFARLAWSLVTMYLGVFFFSFLSYLSRKKFGIEKKFTKEVSSGRLDDVTSYIDTYNSRFFKI